MWLKEKVEGRNPPPQNTGGSLLVINGFTSGGIIPLDTEILNPHKLHIRRTLVAGRWTILQVTC